jgi:hypothetical protein
VTGLTDTCNKSAGIHLKETEWRTTDCIHLAQNVSQWRALVETELNIRVTHTFWDIIE